MDTHADTHAEGRAPADDEGYVPTTTHAEWGAGDPHLRFTDGTHRPDVPLPIDKPRFTIGSGGDADLVLEDADVLHAEILHDERDEYVLVLHGDSETSGFATPQPTTDAPGQILRTGATFTVGPWTLVFQRDEYADHGRPYGGRQGGEGAVQEMQPPPPDYPSQAWDDTSAPGGPDAPQPGDE